MFNISISCGQEQAEKDEIDTADIGDHLFMTGLIPINCVFSIDEYSLLSHGIVVVLTSE